jgi:multidrug efflux pump subunit AcrA (membrane-fusion protein)
MHEVRGKAWYFVPAVMLGVAVLVASIVLKPSPQIRSEEMPARPVAVMALESRMIEPLVTAYGRVRSAIEWKLIPEVSGRVLKLNPHFEAGHVLPKGAVLMQIDPSEYEIAQARAEADRLVLVNQLDGKVISQKNLELSLEIESSQLRLAKQEFERKHQLFTRQLISQSELDRERKAFLVQQQRVQELKNNLTLLPSDIAVLKAQLKQKEASLSDAQRRLSKTEIVLPFDGRVASVSAEVGQPVMSNQIVAQINGINTMEVDAQLSFTDLRILVRGFTRTDTALGSLPDISELDLGASIALVGGQETFRWDASISRLSEAVDPALGTVGLTLTIKQDYRLLQPASLPPLVSGMFVVAHIHGPAQLHWLVPESAVHDGTIYVMNADHRLALIAVQVLFRQDGVAAIHGPDLCSGLQVVTTDVIPTLPGTPLVEVSL